MRLANGSGSIVCLDKSGKKRRKPWAVRITAGWKDGKQVRKYVGYYATQREAISALAEYHNGNINIDFTNITVGELFDMWMAHVANKNLSDSAIRIHKMAKSRFEQLSGKNVKDIRFATWQTWLNNIDLKPASKHKIRNTVQQMLEYAVSNDIVQKNYAKNLEINEKIESTGAVYTQAEIEVLWKHVDNQYARQLLIMIYTGMRIGEMLAIHRDNVNLEEGYMIGGNKTTAGKDRIIPLHDKIIPLVKEQLGDNIWLIQSNRGMAMSYRNAANMYEKFLTDLGIEHKPHDCRKTGVSIMHSSGIPMEVIRIIVGHSGKGVTERTYLFKEPKELVKYINMIEI
jgi:integrase